jgi:phosphopantothenoylcysteine decarboxylase/phosphopantothenate--cysteine ligase
LLMRKNVVVGVCGSIAAYKSCEIVRQLKKRGWNVKVVMTKAASHFITPLTLATLSGNSVYLDMFSKEAYTSNDISHISLSEFADIILVAPATANVIGKLASGVCDDLLTSTIIAFQGKVIFAPAMNDNMWNNKILSENVEKLKKVGYLFVEPEAGELASGKKGTGRLATIEKIVDDVEKNYK